MLVIFPVLFCFSLLYLELQRSDDDADSALWVCSSAGAAQRYPPSNQKGGKRKHATPNPPQSPWPVGCGPLPTHNQPRSQVPPNLRHNWLLKTIFCLPSQMHSVAKYFIGSFQNALRLNVSHWLVLQSQQPLPRLYSEMISGWRACASLVLQVFCLGLLVCSCFTWPFSERSSEALTFARRKVTQAALHGALWWWRQQTHTARWRLLRMHYRDHHLHELPSILGCEIPC